MKRDDIHRQYVTTALALCAPAVRMVQVTAGRDPENEDSWWCVTIPVLAIQTEFRQRYYIYSSGFPDLPNNPDERLDQGWRDDGVETVISALVLDVDYGLISTQDELMKDDCYNSASTLVELPWSYDETKDAAAVEKCVPELRRKANYKIEFEAKAKARRQSAPA
jgi:hypothetical protein